MSRYTRHIFVCENVRPPGHERGCCSEKGSLELRQALKKSLKAKGLGKEVRANAAGCLDACEFGPSVVVYPDAVWYGGVTLGDIDEIVEEHIVGGKPVERLLIKDPRYSSDADSQQNSDSHQNVDSHT
jgi:(2Fe-2S) ferredoxin